MSEYYAVQRSQEYLAHYGIKGMKWGIRKENKQRASKKVARRYQNPDGSLKKRGVSKIAKTAGDGYLNPSGKDKKSGKAVEREKVAKAYEIEYKQAGRKGGIRWSYLF